jgi:hypothetical protein
MARATEERHERELWEERLRARLNATRAPESLRARIHAMLAVELRLGG